MTRHLMIAICLAHLLLTVYPISQPEPQTKTVDGFKVSGEIPINKIENELLPVQDGSESNYHKNENPVGILTEKISGGPGAGAEARGAVSWSQPCAASEGGAGSGSLEYIALDDCFSGNNCSLVLNTFYNVSFRYSAGVTETASLKLDITAMETTGGNPQKQMIDSVLMPTVAFTAPTKNFITRLISFPPKQFVDQTKPYQLQLRLYSQNATSENVVICQTVPITLTGIPGNSGGNVYNAPCATLFKPCTFKNSMCLHDNINGAEAQQVCQCNPEFSYYQGGAGNNCGKIVGSYCGGTGSSECIANAECKVLPSTISAYGECNCKSGFSSDATTPEICYDQTEQNNTNINNVKVHGAACTYVNAPCAYNNSVCVGTDTDGPGSKLTCQCDSSSVYLKNSSITDEPGCKKIPGTYCQNTVECIEHADCSMEIEGDKSGYCTCSQGYTNSNDDLTKCSSGGRGRGGSPGFHSAFVIFPIFLHVIGLLTLLN